MSEGDTVPLHPKTSSQSDIDEIRNLVIKNAFVPPVAAPPSAVKVEVAPRLPSPPRASIPVISNDVGAPYGKSANGPLGLSSNITLTEPVWETVRRDLMRIGSNLKQVVLPNPFREDPGKALRDWDLWGPFFFVLLLGLLLSWSASIGKSEVFAVAFAILAAGAIVLTLNVLLLGGHMIFFQSLSLLGYCLFPLDIGALVCMLKNTLAIKMIVVLITFAWSTWAAYPFMSSAVRPSRKGLALYPVFLLYISVGFLIFAVN